MGVSAEDRAKIDIWELFSRHLRIFLTDFDGTISSYVPRPDDAVILGGCRTNLVRIAQQVKQCWVISGRSAQDVKSRVGVTGLLYCGNQGLEFLENGKVIVAPEAVPYKQAVRKAWELLPKVLVDFVSKIILEDKEVVVQVHARGMNPQEVEEMKRVVKESEIGQLGLRFVDRGDDLEIRPPVETHKALAVRHLLAEARRGLTPDQIIGVIYCGDDVENDAAAMLEIRNTPGVIALCIGVIRDETRGTLLDELSDIRVSSVEEMGEALAALADALEE